MIIGTGIDTVEIVRFKKWHAKSYQSLCRLFSEEEIAYCMQQPLLSAQRFAVRFAAREAVYKAISEGYYVPVPPFLTLARAISIDKNQSGKPFLTFDRQILDEITYLRLTTVTWHISLAHTRHMASAWIIAELVSV
jgi:holo-[acyl-carrier protein] synthase